MKWKTSRFYSADFSWRRVFLFWPRRCTDGYTRWLCMAARSVRHVNDAPVFVYRPLSKLNHY